MVNPRVAVLLVGLNLLFGSLTRGQNPSATPSPQTDLSNLRAVLLNGQVVTPRLTLDGAVSWVDPGGSALPDELNGLGVSQVLKPETLQKALPMVALQSAVAELTAPGKNQCVSSKGLFGKTSAQVRSLKIDDRGLLVLDVGLSWPDGSAQAGEFVALSRLSLDSPEIRPSETESSCREIRWPCRRQSQDAKCVLREFSVTMGGQVKKGTEFASYLAITSGNQAALARFVAAMKALSTQLSTTPGSEAKRIGDVLSPVLYESLKKAFAQGQDAMIANRFSDAVSALTRATRIDSQQHVVWAQLAEAYGGLAKTLSNEEKKEAIVQAVNALSTAVRIKPDEAAYLSNYGGYLGKAGRVDEAVAMFDKALKLDSANADRYDFNAAAVLINVERYREAALRFGKIPRGSPFREQADLHEFRAVLMAYVAAAPAGFQDLRDKILADVEGIKVWDVVPELPGGKCGLSASRGSSQLSCSFGTAKDLSQLLATYRSIVSKVRAALPAEWAGRDVSRPDSNSVGAEFRSGATQVRIDLFPDQRNVYNLALSVRESASR